MKRCEDCERLEARLLRADRKIVELTGESNRLRNMAVQCGSQNGVFQNRAQVLRVERDEARDEVERLSEVVRKAHTIAEEALSIKATTNWTFGQIANAFREIHRITKEKAEP